jgi:acyl-CoA reductase-like NAD-dependent aldehyde dehydrogenase
MIYRCKKRNIQESLQGFIQSKFHTPDITMTTGNLNARDYSKLFLNGEYVAAQNKETYALKNPKDNSVVTENVPIAGPADVELAVKYAEEAFQGPWSRFTAVQRTECFLKLATLLDEELTPILTLDSLTSGVPVSLAPIRERNYIRNCVLYYAGWTDKQKGDYFPADDGE